MIDKDYIELGQERKLLDEGHNLSIVDWEGKRHGFLGQVGFDGIKECEFYKSKVEVKPISLPMLPIPKRRTATVIADSNAIHLFCARKVGFNRTDIYKHQKIEYWIGGHSFFTKAEDVTDGSAPFIFAHDGLYYLYFHRRKDNNHKILVKCAQTLDGLKGYPEVLLLEADHSFSMPSVAYLHGWFWLTCEEMVGGQWRTVLYKSKSPMSNFQLVGVLLDAPCVYQHIIDGRYFITYSRKEGDKWGIWIKEQI